MVCSFVDVAPSYIALPYVSDHISFSQLAVTARSQLSSSSKKSSEVLLEVYKRGIVLGLCRGDAVHVTKVSLYAWICDTS